MARRLFTLRLAALLLLPLLLLAPATATAEGAAGRADPPPPVPLAKLEGPSGVAVAFSRDGRRILTAGKDGARVWDAQTYKPVTEPLKHGPNLGTAVMSTDGKAVITAAGNEVRLWDADTGRQRLALRADGDIRTAAFSPDGRTVLAAGDDRHVRLWDAASGELLLSREHPAIVYRAEFSADGTKVLAVTWLGLVAGGTNAEGPIKTQVVVYVWDSRTGRDVGEPVETGFDYDGYHPWLRPAALSPDGTKLATSRSTAGVYISDVGSGKHVATAPMKGDEHHQGTETVGQVHFTPDGRRFLTTGWLATPVLWDAATGEPAVVWKKMWGGETAQFSADGRRVLFAGVDGVAWVADTAEQRLMLELGRPTKAIPAAALSPDGQRVALGIAEDGWTGVYEVPPLPPPDGK